MKWAEIFQGAFNVTPKMRRRLEVGLVPKYVERLCFEEGLSKCLYRPLDRFRQLSVEGMRIGYESLVLIIAHLRLELLVGCRCGTPNIRAY